MARSICPFPHSQLTTSGNVFKRCSATMTLLVGRAGRLPLHNVSMVIFTAAVLHLADKRMSEPPRTR